MDYYKLFYWLCVADNAKTFFVASIVLVTITLVIAIICLVYAHVEDTDGKVRSRKWVAWTGVILILFWFLYIFTPSKKDALLIVAGGGTMNFLASDSAAKQIPRELSTFVLTELKSISEEAKVELGVLSQKDKILDEAKKMTAEQLMERMKVDTTFAKIVLHK